MISLRKALKLSDEGIVSLVGAGGKTSLMTALALELSQHGEPVLMTTTTKIRRPAEDKFPVVVIEKDPLALIDKCKTSLQRKSVVTAAADLSEARNKLVGFPAEVVDEIWRSGLFKWIVVEADGAARKPIKAPAEHEPVIPRESRWVVGLVGLLGVGKPFTDQWVFRPEHFQRITGLQAGDTVSASAIASILLDSRGLTKGAPAGARKIFFLNQADTKKQIAHAKQIVSLLDTDSAGFDSAVIGRLKPSPKIIDRIVFNG